MVNAVSRDIMELLSILGVGEPAAQDGWGLYIGSEPGSPDITITIYDTGGSPIEGLGECSVIDDWTIQVRVRSDDYEVTRKKLQEVVDALNLRKNYQVNNDVNEVTYYEVIYRADVPQEAAYDENDRSVWTCNFRGLRKFVTT